MELYESRCPDCKTAYIWTGYKTGIGKSESQLKVMAVKDNVCRNCNSVRLETGCAGLESYFNVKKTEVHYVEVEDIDSDFTAMETAYDNYLKAREQYISELSEKEKEEILTEWQISKGRALQEYEKELALRVAYDKTIGKN